MHVEQGEAVIADYAGAAFANADGRSALVVGGQAYFLGEISGGSVPSDPQRAIETAWPEIERLAALGSYDGGVPLARVRLGPPVPRPRAVFGIGLNYLDHAQEARMDPPEVPPVFTKFPTSICGPFDDIVIPQPDANVDYEAELVFVVAKEAKGISAPEAVEYLAGYTCGQDISERRLQFAAGRQFSIGKSYDTFFPMGPVLVPATKLGDGSDLSIRCRVNGEVVQNGTTSSMVFSVPQLVEFLSSVVTLRPGDVCLTGTPAGVGYVRNPPLYLRPGDVLETEISRIGKMRNVCRSGWG